MHTVAANGAEIPAIGFGTWTLKGAECANLVAKAIEAGYRHIDTAAFYGNEEAVGQGLRDSGLDREEVFVTTKIWHSDLADGALQKSLEDSLNRLGLDDVDLALIHWPSKTVPLAESIPALNEVRDRGWTRHIGVSNFTVSHLAEATELSSAALACNQIEHHPLLAQDKVRTACASKGIAVTSYCPLARGADLFSESAIAAPAARLGVTPAQAILRWHVQQDDVIAIPRTANPSRLAENLDVFSFSLDQAEMDAITALGSAQYRICDFEFSPVWDAV